MQNYPPSLTDFFQKFLNPTHLEGGLHLMTCIEVHEIQSTKMPKEERVSI